MKRILSGFAGSVVVLSLSAGAFACPQQTADSNKNQTIILAQAGGTGSSGTSSGGPAVTEPQEKTIGAPRKTETVPAAPAAPAATDTTGSTGAVDASQSKRKDTNEPAQAGSK